MRALAACVLTFALLLSGCMAPPADDDPPPHVPPRTEPDWTNPYTFPLHFDGWRAYSDLLAHIYDDPINKTMPRYRVPGTETHAEAALQLQEWLAAALAPGGGTALLHNFTGSDYYALDLSPVETFLCPTESPARERVRGLNFSNVVGRTHSDEIGIIIGAHWDSKAHVDVVLERAHVDPDYLKPHLPSGAENPDFDPERHGTERAVLGADDGASGTVAVIELARAFTRARIDIPLTFVLFDGEDGFEWDDCHPLAGSLHYAQSLDAAERETARAMILLDMVGNATARYYRESYSQCYPISSCAVDSTWLVDHVWQVAAEMGVAAFVNQSTGFITDDHHAFLHAGIHAIDIIRYEHRFPPYWHTSLDDHRAVHPMGLHQVGQVVEASIRLLAAEPERFP